MAKLTSSCAILQPTYLPWSGYFNLMNDVDHFVFLIDVQYERRSWQMRNRVALNGNEHLLTIPIAKCSQTTLLLNVMTRIDTEWIPHHWNILTSSYKKCKHGPEVLDLLEPHYQTINESRSLIDFNIQIIKQLASYLSVKCTMHDSSQLTSHGTRSQKLASLCHNLGCDDYLSPVGSRAYLEEDGFVQNYKIDLSFQNFTPVFYKQHKCDQFISHLSMIDVIANLGQAAARDYIQSSTTC